MSASTMSQTSAAVPVSGKTHMLKQLTISELRLILREPRRVWGIALPVVLLIVLGFIPTFNTPSSGLGGFTPIEVYVPIVILMSMTLMAVTMMPMILAGYREHGILRRLRTTPAGPARVLAAQLIINVGAAAISVLVVLLVAKAFYQVPFPRQPVAFVLVVLLAIVTMQAIGLFVAAVASTTMAAQVLGGLLFFPMLFFSGLWFPIPLMSPPLQDISHLTPLGAGWEAMAATATGHWPPVLPVAVLVGYAVVCGLVAAKSFRWE